MKSTRADVEDHMEGDTASEASQEYVEYEDTPPSDVIESKLKLSSDLEQSFTTFTGNTNGRVGAEKADGLVGSNELYQDSHGGTVGPSSSSAQEQLNPNHRGQPQRYCGRE